MSTLPKKKLCWNCEGRVSLEEENCPYCAVYLGPAPDEQGGRDILAPPYRIVESDEDVIPESPYASNEETEEELNIELGKGILENQGSVKEMVLPMGLMSAGSLFLIFSLILLIFSQHGELVLSWNADYWYFYLAGALPMLIFGWSLLQRSEIKQSVQSDD